MNEPMEEQKQEFWEYWGFRHLPIRPLPDGKPHPTLKYWLYPDGESGNELPAIDLNSLFKWAVPKAYSILFLKGHGIRGTYNLLFDRWLNCFMEMEGVNLDLALFWALDKVRGEQ